MKITLQNNSCVLESVNAAETKKLVDFYYGNTAVVEVTPKVKSEKRAYHFSKRSYKRKCEICGLKFKRLETHKKFKHELQGKVGWHKTGENPYYKKNPDAKKEYLVLN